MPFVVKPPSSPPLEPPAEDGSQLWEVLYDSLGFHRRADETGQLQMLCEALMAPLQRAYDQIRERGGRAAGGTMLDPDNVDAAGLEYLAQYVGAKLRPVADEAQRRAEIKHPTTWKRGQVETIKLVAQRTLLKGADSFVRVRVRYPGPGQTYVRTLLSETPDPGRVQQELEEEGVPAWDLLDYDAIDGVTVGDVAASTKWTTVADLAAAFPTVKALTEILPDEL